MKLENYQSGKFLRQSHSMSFSPSKIDVVWTWEDNKINSLLSEANIKIGTLEAFSLRIPEIDTFIEMNVAKEATTSSKIEGTRTEIDEVMKSSDNIRPERRDDWQEVQNYIKAMNFSIDKLTTLPLSSRLLRQAHKILMSGARGQHRAPGKFRESQNWIGGSTINDAVYVPPVHSEINDLMSDLEKFLHNETTDIPVLIKIAVAHYQFEAIHPFLDGNGRIGRLLITLYLVHSGMLSKPSLYISEYFEKHRQLYYDNLNNVRLNNDMIQWIKFFLVGIIETSNKGIETFDAILSLDKNIREARLPKLKRRKNIDESFLKLLYKKPLITSKEIQRELGVSLPTIHSLLTDFEDLGILKELTGYKRNREFEFTEYLDLFRDKRS